jgi:alpha-1,6-mannosyltransferase
MSKSQPQLTKHKQNIKPILLFFTFTILYVACICFSYQSSLTLRMGRATLSDVHQAYFTEALPFALSILLSVMIPKWVVKITHYRKVQILSLTILSLGVTLGLLLAPLSYSLDVLRYLWNGRLVLHGISPYLYVPIDKHLTSYQNWPYWHTMGWKTWPEAYPPLSQYEFAILTWVGHGTIHGYKLALFLQSLLSVFLFALILSHPYVPNQQGNHTSLQNHIRAWRRSFTDWTARDVCTFGIFALFPPLLVESYGAGHVDTLTIPWLLAAWLCAKRNHLGGLGFFIGLAASIKIYPIVLLAAFWIRTDWRGISRSILACVAAIGLSYLPLVAMGQTHHLFSFFSHIQQMEYNDSLTKVLQFFFGTAVLHASTLLVFAGEGIATLGILLSPVYFLPTERKVCLLGLTFMLLSPVMHPWYLLTLLPFALYIRDKATLWFAATIHFTYDQIPLDMYIEYLPTYYWFFQSWHLPFRKCNAKITEV